MQISWPYVQIAALILQLAVVIQSVQVLRGGLGSADEIRLVRHLFTGYNELIRPVSNLTDKLSVEFGLAMIQLINVDEKNQIMKSNVWLRMRWEDYQLKWDAQQFGGIKVIRIPSHKVWIPDIVLFNNADGKYEVSYKPNVVISNTGEVLWIPPAIYRSSCTINVRYFPFDQQTCEMKFGSWTFNGDQVDLKFYDKRRHVDLSDYVNSGTWDIIDCPGEYNVTYNAHERHNVARIVFRLVIRRKTLFYTVNLIIPCILISLISVCVFYLPADAGEKMTMCISILLALVVFMLLVSKILPPTSLTIPLIAKYLLFTFIMNIFTIFITVIIINWNFRTPRTHRMPRWVRVIFLRYLPRILFMKRPSFAQRFANKPCYNINSNASSRRTSTVLRNNRSCDLDHVTGGRSQEMDNCPVSVFNRRTNSMEMADVRRNHVIESRGSGGGRNHSNCVSPTSPFTQQANETRASLSGASHDIDSTFQMTPEIHKAVEAVRFIAAHLKNEDDYLMILEDWRYIAMVIDRLQLYIFLFVTIVGSLLILIYAPHIFEFVDQEEIKQRILEKDKKSHLLS